MAVLGVVIGGVWSYWTAIPIVLLLQYRQYAAIKSRVRKSVLKRFWQTTEFVGCGLTPFLPIRFPRNKQGNAV